MAGNRVNICDSLSHSNAWNKGHIDSPRLVEYIADISFTLAEPHVQELRTLHRNEVYLAFIGYCFGKQRFPCSNNIEKSKNDPSSGRFRLGIKYNRPCQTYHNPEGHTTKLLLKGSFQIYQIFLNIRPAVSEERY